MISYMYKNRHTGIMFSSKSPMQPVVFSDASSKPDATDGLSRYGFSVQMSGGPIAFNSKKLAHVGLSAFHNEYMALRYAAGTAMWARNILQEIGCSHLLTEPTQVYGDNLMANRLTAEDFVSTNNQYIYLPYHWTKELVKGGHICMGAICSHKNEHRGPYDKVG